MSTKYKFKKLSKKIHTQEFWYDISSGGYLKPSQFSSDPKTKEAILEAVKLLQILESMCGEELGDE